MKRKFLIIFNFICVCTLFSMEQEPSQLEQMPSEVLLNIVTNTFQVNPTKPLSDNIKSLFRQKSDLIRTNKLFAQFAAGFEKDILKVMADLLAGKFSERDFQAAIDDNIKNKRKDVVKVLVNAGTPILRHHFTNVVRRNWPDVFELMLKNGNLKNINKNELLVALLERDMPVDFIDLLLKSGGIDPNYKTKEGDSPLLSIAISKLNKPYGFVKTLLDSGADVNTMNQSKITPLITAAMNESPEIINLLLKYKPNVNLQNKYGRTALIESILAKKTVINSPTFSFKADNPKDKKEVVQALINAGASVNINDTDGLTALDHAKYIEGLEEIRDILASSSKIS